MTVPASCGKLLIGVCDPIFGEEAVYNILVVGGGSIGERHVRCILATGRAEVSVCDLNGELLEELAQKYDLKQTFAEFDSLDLSQFDGVLIAAPANLHIGMARKVVAAGVHLFCEKPLTVRDEGVTELLEEIDRAGVVAGVGFTWRYMASMAELDRQLKDGRIGKLQHITIWAGQYFPIYRPAYKRVYCASLETGGGAILDAMSHMVSLTQMFAGRVQSVYGMYYNSGLIELDVEDTVDVLLQLKTGVRANIHLTQWQHNSEAEIMLKGAQGSLRYSAERKSLGLCSEIDGPWQETALSYERDDNYIAEANNFFNAMESKEELRCSVAEAYHTSKVCWAIRESFDHGQRIDISD